MEQDIFYTSPSPVPASNDFSRRNHLRQGSLPLKKRKFNDLDDSSLKDGTGMANTCGSRFLETSKLPSHAISASSSRVEKIAALALVAAIASTEPGSVSPRSNNEHPSSPRQTSSPISSPTSAIGELKPEDASPSTHRRIHHRPLASPLPNGCHGRTSRNNSFCRRQPCYNGTTYCKLHYQQYVLSSVQSPCEAEGDATASLDSLATHACVAETRSVESLPIVPSLLQDKRFTGTGDEIRCLATTTRGRACAYVAVGSTKYCYLHSDYDANPPPRRGGAFLRRTESGDASDRSHMQVLNSRNQDTPSPSPTSLTVSQVPESIKMTGGDVDGLTISDLPSSKNEADENLEVNSKEWHRFACEPSTTHSAYPLLSMISTDQWYQKKVIVLIGPLTNRTGRVEKWGNGWVSVQIPGMGVHNRRSFELVLHPDQRDEIMDNVVNDTSPKQLRRCVSHEARDGVTEIGTLPEMVYGTGNDQAGPEPGTSDFTIHKSMDSLGSNAGDKHVCRGRESIRTPSPPSASDNDKAADEVPCPVTPYHQAEVSSKTGNENKPYQARDFLENEGVQSKNLSKLGAVDNSKKDKSQIEALKVQPGLPIVSPTSSHASRSLKNKDIRIIERVPQTHATRQPSNLDLLFGAAAIERSLLTRGETRGET